MKAICAAFPAILLVACDPAPGGRAADDGTAQRPAGRPDARVECAVSGSGLFERACTVEQSAGDDGAVLTLRAPDGSFRRLLVTRDGRGVVAADGAEPARVTPLGEDRIQVAIGRDRYRLPATVRNSTP